MGFFNKSKQKDVEDTRSNLVPEEKQVNLMSTYPDGKVAVADCPEFDDEKIAMDRDDLIASPTSEDGTLLPAYRSEGSTATAQGSSRSTMLSSIGSSSEVAPDFHPVTSKALMPDDGMEVVISGKAAHAPSVPNSIQVSRSYREYNFYYDSLTHLIICDPNQQVLFFAEVSPFAKGMPDVQFRDIAAGGFGNLAQMGQNLGLKEAKDAPVVAVADAMPSSKHIKLGLGDPLHPETNTWVVMRNVHDDPKNNSEKYDMAVTKQGKLSTYQWISGAGSSEPSNSPRMGTTRRNSDSKEIFKLLSDEGLIASFRNTGMASMKKRGALRVYETPGMEELLLLIFLSCSALCERDRRRKVKKSLFMGTGSMWSKRK